MSPVNWKKVALLSAAVLISAGSAYAVFTSNTVSINGNRLSTGTATLRICDSGASNVWTESLSSVFNLTDMIPNEERDLLGERAIHFGNDDGFLAGLIGNANCQGYDANVEVGSSDTPLKIIPAAAFDEESCPDPLPSNLKLRFEVNGIDTGYKTLNGWRSNKTQFGEALQPGEAGRLKAFAQLSTTTVDQGAECQFGLQFTGKQTT